MSSQQKEAARSAGRNGELATPGDGGLRDRTGLAVQCCRRGRQVSGGQGAREEWRPRSPVCSVRLRVVVWGLPGTPDPGL